MMRNMTLSAATAPPTDTQATDAVAQTGLSSSTNRKGGTFRHRTIDNCHARWIDASPAQIAELFRGLAGPHDPFWPERNTEPMRFDRPIGVGATGGHGPVRYHVTEFDPPRIARFEFLPGTGIVGEHRFEAEPYGDGMILRHVLAGQLEGPMRLLWAPVVRWLHDETIQDAFDRAERATTGTTSPRLPPRWTRLLLRLAPRSMHEAAAAERVARDAGVFA